MNDHTNQMLTAIDEVETIAEELRALRDQTKKYGDASRRLSEIGDVLRDLGNSVERIQVAFNNALGQIEQTQAHAESGKIAVETLVDSIPEIVQRIEASDAFGAAAALTTSMREVEALLRSHEWTIGELVQKFAEEREAAGQTLGKLSETTERSLAAIAHLSSGVAAIKQATVQGGERVEAMNGTIRDDLLPKVCATQHAVEEVKTLTNHVREGSNRAADAMAEHSAKMLRELATMREELGATHRLLAEQGRHVLQQGQLLDEISKRKKGWFN